MKIMGKRTVTERVEITIGLDDSRKAVGLPKDATITFRTPSGYDCSNEDVTLDEGDQVLTATYEVVQEEPRKEVFRTLREALIRCENGTVDCYGVGEKHACVKERRR